MKKIVFQGLALALILIGFYNCKNIEKDWAIAQSSPNIADQIIAIEAFGDKYPESELYKDSVTLLLESLYFEKAFLDNNIDSIQKVIKKYPKSTLVKKAEDQIRTLDFEKVKSIQTIEAYQGFRHKYPNADLADWALDSIIQIEYRQAIKVNTMAAFNSYRKKYPKDPGSFELACKIVKVFSRQAERAKTEEGKIKIVEKIKSDLRKNGYDCRAILPKGEPGIREMNTPFRATVENKHKLLNVLSYYHQDVYTVGSLVNLTLRNNRKYTIVSAPNNPITFLIDSRTDAPIYLYGKGELQRKGKTIKSF